MIEVRRLKNVVIFVQTILSFVLSRKIININNCTYESGSKQITNYLDDNLLED